MKNIWTIMKKEFTRFFTDKRMLAGIILPGVLIFIIYSLIGNVLSNVSNVSNTYEYSVYMVNEPEAYKVIDTMNKDYVIKVNSIESNQIEETKELIKDKKADLLIVYPVSLETNGETIPSINIYFNSTRNESSTIYQYYQGALSQFSIKEVKYNFTLNTDVNETYNLATKEDVSGQVISMIMPYLLVLLLFSGAMGIVTDSIAGEKERGTIATLLVTPIKRNEIALGKIFALSVVSLASALSSFIGIILSLPKLMQGMADSFTITMYGFSDYLLIFLLIAACVILFTSILSLVSCLAKTIKEATTYCIPIMMIVMIAGLTSMISQGSVPSNPVLYLIPIYNITASLTSIFAGKLNPLLIGITLGSTFVYVSLFVFVLTKLFSNERVMFNK